MKLLMHICCAPCALHPVSVLRGRGIDLRGLWFNPNIHPYAEYRNRLDALRRLQVLWDLDVAYIDHYGLTEFLRSVVHHEEDRCEYCYLVRLDKTARMAREMDADGFTTSLLVSPYQKFDMIMDIGKMMAERYSIGFHGEDFRTGYREGRRLSREFDLYRQKYCGCIYSEQERNLKRDE